MRYVFIRRILRAALLVPLAVSVLAAPAAPRKPKLILAVVVDQFRYDYLLRFRAEYTAGFKTILERGAVFDDAHHIHYPTVTAVGHSTFLSGATPSLSGIVGNEWFDRATKKAVTSVSDDETRLVGGLPGAAGSSPRKLLVSTVGDEIKMQGQPVKVIGVSIKDRSAILPVGHMADSAYWFDDRSSHWVTSSYYMDKLPGWVDEINAAKTYMRASGAQWFALDAKPGDPPLCTMTPGQAVRYCGSLEATPWGNEMIEEFAEQAVVAEKMGQHAGTDLLAVSFSANDYVGHAVGPDDPAVRDIAIRTDRSLGKLLDVIGKQVGMDNVMFVLTADHGVAPVPEVNTRRKMPAGRLSGPGVLAVVEKTLEDKYGPGRWIVGSSGVSPYLSRELMSKYGISAAEAELSAAEAVREMPHIFRVYTAEDVRTGRLPDDIVSKAVTYGYYPQRSGDLFVLQDPYYLWDASGTSHGTPFGYDSHVPVIFMGPGIRPGHYYEKIAINDIAPTLAAIAGVEAPSGSIGRVLEEMWQ